MARDAHSDLKPWQWVQQSRVVWKVMDFASVKGIPHVHISKVGDPTERKLISVSTLRDGYDLLPESGPAQKEAPAKGGQ